MVSAHTTFLLVKMNVVVRTRRFMSEYFVVRLAKDYLNVSC